jgi:hypothetical protein
MIDLNFGFSLQCFESATTFCGSGTSFLKVIADPDPGSALKMNSEPCGFGSRKYRYVKKMFKDQPPVNFNFKVIKVTVLLRIFIPITLLFILFVSNYLYF